MKVIRITTLLDFGGQEQKLISLTENKKLLKNEYIFISIGFGGHASKLISGRGFRVLVLNKIHSIYHIQNIWTLYKLLKKENPDVVHTAAAEANLHGVIAAKLAGIKIIYAEEIGFPNHSTLAKRVFKYVYRLTNGVICVSKSVKQYLTQINELKTEKGIVLYNPVSIPQYYVRSPMTKFQMVYVGRLEKVKNVSFLIKAFSCLNEKNRCELTIVGEGRERKTIENLIIDLSLEELVHLVGFSDEPDRYVSQADLFVLSSLSEGFGIAAVEAMYQGVPCLCTNVGGIPEFITDGKNGWLFNPSNLHELISKMNTILNMKKQDLHEIGLKGKEHALTHFSIENYIQTLEEIYQTSNK